MSLNLQNLKDFEALEVKVVENGQRTRTEMQSAKTRSESAFARRDAHMSCAMLQTGLASRWA